MSLINFDSKMLNFSIARPNSIVNSDCLNQTSFYDRPINVHEMEDLGNAITIFHNIIDEDMCQHMIEKTYTHGHWEKAITIGESLNTVDAKNSPRQNNICHITSNKAFEDIDSYLHRVYTNALNTYLLSMGIENGVLGAGISADEGYSMLHYTSGGYYKKHIDYSSQFNGDRPPLIRAITGLIYLNDDYGAGKVLFNRQKISIKPTKGSIIFFPSIYTHPHTASAITSGNKYCIVTWWR